MKEEDLIKQLKKKLKKRNKYGISDERIFEHDIGTTSTNIPFAIKNKNKALSSLVGVLYSDNKAIYMNETVKKNRQVDKNKKVKIYKYLKDDTEKLLTKVYNKIDFMQNEDKELQKLNSLSLQKTSKCFFQTNRPKTKKFDFHSFEGSNIKTQNSNFEKIFFKKKTNNLKALSFNNLEEKNSWDNKLLSSRNYELNNIYTNENTKEETCSNRNSIKLKRTVMSAWNKTKKTNLSTYNNNQSKFAKSVTTKKIFFPIDLYENKGEERFRNLIDVDVEKLYATNKKKKLNLSRINEIYRVQMNKSLKKYHPERHLKELNKIQLNNIKVRKDMEKVKGKINKQLDDRGQGQFYKKEYLKFKEENEKEKKIKIHGKKSYPINIPFNIVLKDENEDNGYKIRAYYDYCANCDRIQKSKNNDLMEFGADLLFGHINSKDHELLYDSLDELFNALEINPIMKYIDEMKNEKVNREQNVINERFKKYFPVFTETEKILQQMEKRKITKEKKLDDGSNILQKIHDTKKLIELAENDKHIPHINQD